MEPEILFSRTGGVGRMLLNRPKALNALTLEMSHALEKQLRGWAVDDRVRAVAIRAAGERAFCAGGDIRKLYEVSKTGGDYPYRFWADEYRLDALIKHYRKPYVALIDGIAMGGGVGISVHGCHRVVSEHAVFAMPETGIGLFPDVGGSYFLPRCPCGRGRRRSGASRACQPRPDRGGRADRRRHHHRLGLGRPRRRRPGRRFGDLGATCRLASAVAFTS